MTKMRLADLSDPDTLRRLIHIKESVVPETCQGDVLLTPPLSSATVADCSRGILLPAVSLGPLTNMIGVPGYNKGSTEYHIHFALPTSARARLQELCYESLKQEFIKNTGSIRPFVQRAFDMSPSDEVDDAWNVFKSMARVAWRDDGTFLVKQRETSKRPRPVCVRSAEGVEHTGKLKVASATVVRLDVRIVTWGFKDMFGTSLKLGIGGISVYHTSTMPVTRSTFLPGNFYLCVKPSGEFEIRDACGHSMFIKIPNRGDANRILVDSDFARDVNAMEDKLGCPLSCIKNDDDESYIAVQGTKGTNSNVVITPHIITQKGMRQLHWTLHFT